MAKYFKISKKLVGIFFIIGGGIFIAFSLGFGLESAIFKMNSAGATGTIVDLIERRSHDGDATYLAVFSFAAADGEEYTVRNNIATYPPLGKVGDEVKVEYQRDQPQNARIAGPFALLFIFVFALVGLVIVAIGVLFIRSYNRSKEE